MKIIDKRKETKDLILSDLKIGMCFEAAGIIYIKMGRAHEGVREDAAFRLYTSERVRIGADTPVKIVNIEIHIVD